MFRKNRRRHGFCALFVILFAGTVVEGTLPFDVLLRPSDPQNVYKVEFSFTNTETSNISFVDSFFENMFMNNVFNIVTADGDSPTYIGTRDHIVSVSAFVTLQPGETFHNELDLSKGYYFSKKGVYTLTWRQQQNITVFLRNSFPSVTNESLNVYSYVLPNIQLEIIISNILPLPSVLDKNKTHSNSPKKLFDAARTSESVTTVGSSDTSETIASGSTCTRTCRVQSDSGGPVTFSCSEIACQSGPKSFDASCTNEPPTTTGSSDTCGTIASASTCTRTCNQQDYSGGPVTFTCTDGNFGPAVGSCLASCTTQPSPTTGITTTCPTTASTQTCVRQCDTGFTGGSVTFTCTKGTWGNAVGTCVAASCTTQPSPTTGITTTCPTTASGKTCVRQCGTGFTGGPVNFTCTKGAWSTAVGTCVAKKASTTTITIPITYVTQNQGIQGVVVEVKGQVGLAAPTGTINLLRKPSTPLPFTPSTGQLSNGKGTFSIATPPIGTLNILAQYSGSGTYAASSSSALAITVVANADSKSVLTIPTTTVKSTVAITFKVSITGVKTTGLTPTGTVDFYNSTKKLAGKSVTLSKGAGSFSGKFAKGTYLINGHYNGDINFAASVTTTVKITIT